MFWQRNFSVIVSIFLATFFILTTNLHGSCTRDDVDFYLEKGFTNDQIALICSGQKRDIDFIEQSSFDNDVLERESTTSLSSPPNVTQNDSFLNEPYDEKWAKRMLPSAIDAYNVFISEQYLHYTIKNCIEYGDEDLFGFRERACPEIQYFIEWKGLEIKNVWKEYYFLGKSKIRVKGKIDYKILSGTENIPPASIKLFEKKLLKEGEIVIPVRDDVPLINVEKAFLLLVQ